jgi:NAD(P)-dependent dehydrogenase (short-subunit alcohol dehydrogenase family)
MSQHVIHDLTGEIAIVTGAGRGIGAATARALAARGARVVVSAREQAKAQAVVQTLRPETGIAVACDVTDRDHVARLVAETERSFGKPSILINNAGVVQPIGLLDAVDPEAFAHAIRVTLIGAAFACQAVLPTMLEAGRGRIINLSSGAAHRPLEGWSAYCAAKAGLAMLTRSLALEYGERGIKVFGFSPGVVDTDMQADIRASGINAVSRLPRGSLAPAEEPATAIVYLSAAASDGLAGQEIDIRTAEFRKAAALPALPA